MKKALWKGKVFLQKFEIFSESHEIQHNSTDGDHQTCNSDLEFDLNMFKVISLGMSLMLIRDFKLHFTYHVIILN